MIGNYKREIDSREREENLRAKRELESRTREYEDVSLIKEKRYREVSEEMASLEERRAEYSKR